MTTVPPSREFPVPLWGSYMVCPACGQNHARIIGGGVEPGEVTGMGHTFGSAFMTLQGDCGHRWEVTAQFSKGQVELTTAALDGDA